MSYYLFTRDNTHLFDLTYSTDISTHCVCSFSQLISYAWFNLTCNHAPRAYPRGFVIFQSFLEVHSPPPEHAEIDHSPPRAADRPHIRFLGTSFWSVQKQNETFSQLSRTFSKVYWEKDNGCHNVVKTWTIKLKTKTKKENSLKSASLTEQFIRTLDWISVSLYISKALYPFSYISFLVIKARLKKHF